MSLSPEAILPGCGDELPRPLGEAGCAFRCLGCNGPASAEHEVQALKEHVRFLLDEVLNIRKQLKQLLPQPQSSTAKMQHQMLRRQTTERLPGPFSGPTPSASSTAPVGEAAGHQHGGGLERWASNTPPARVPVTAAFGCRPDVSEDDLLNLLQDQPLAREGGQLTPAVASIPTALQELPPPPTPSESPPPSSVHSPQAAALEMDDEEVPLPPPTPPTPPRVDPVVQDTTPPCVDPGGRDDDLGIPTSADRAGGPPLEHEKTLTMPGPVEPPDREQLRVFAHGEAVRGEQPVDVLPAGAYRTVPNPPEPLPRDGLVTDEIQRRLNKVTSDLQAERISNSTAAASFTEMINLLPAGKLRCSALLNRAHCQVHLGHYAAALADTDAIIQGDQAPNFDAKRWHKVWLIRGTIHRKLAQCSGNDANLFAKARDDYEHVIQLRPEHSESITKARRCIEQLSALQHSSVGVGCGGEGARRLSVVGGKTVADASDAVGALAGTEAACSANMQEDATQPAMDIGAAPLPFCPAGQAAPSKVAARSESVSVSPEKRRKLEHLPSMERRIDDAIASDSGLLFDAAFARRSLVALGRDCAAAGLELFEEGVVRETSNAPPPAVSTPVRGSRHSPSPPRRPSPTRRLGLFGSGRSSARRVFEIRSPQAAGPTETVILEPRNSAASDGKVGECSCWLRWNCKHVAAALCAIKREDGGLVESQDRLERSAEKMTIDELKELLRLNNQLLGGTKVELVRRVADAAARGALPPCPRCGGHLHPESGARFRCRKLNRDMEACGYEVGEAELERKPFKGSGRLHGQLLM